MLETMSKTVNQWTVSICNKHVQLILLNLRPLVSIYVKWNELVVIRLEVLDSSPIKSDCSTVLVEQQTELFKVHSGW